MSKETRFIKYTNEFVYNEYNSKVLPRLTDIQSMLYTGYSMEQIANELGIPYSLLWYMRYKQCYPDLCDIFEQEQMLVQNVKNALYRRAVGYYVTEDTAIKVKVEYFNAKGKKGTREEVKIVPVRKYIQPDVQAIKFFLCNKDSKNFKDNAQAGNTEETTQELLNGVDDILIKIKTKAEEDGQNL